MVESEDHEFELESVFGDTYREFTCFKEEKASLIKHGYDFSYCPHCGEELDCDE